MKKLLTAFLLPLFLAGLLPAAEPIEKRIATLFAPNTTEQMALSPDGLYVAYAVRDGDKLDLLVVSVDQPKDVRRLKLGSTVIARLQAGANAVVHKLPVLLIDLVWATPDRLVYLVDNPEKAPSEGLARLELRSYSVSAKKELKLADSDPYSHHVTPPPVAAAKLPSMRPVNLTSASGATAEVRVTPEGSVVAEVKNPDGTTSTQIISRPDPTRATPTISGSTTNTGGMEVMISRSGTPAAMGPAATPLGIRGRFNLLGFRPDDPNQAVVETRGYNARETTVYQVDVTNGTMVAAPPFESATSESVLYDQQFRPRFTWTLPSASTGYGVFGGFLRYRGPGYDQWTSPNQILGATSFFSRNLGNAHTLPLAFDRDPNLLYVATNAGRDTFALRSYDLRTREFGDIRIENPAFDQAFSGSPITPRDTLIFDRVHRLAGIATRGVVPATLWLDPELGRWQEQLNAAYPKNVVRIRAWSDDHKRIVGEVSSASDPGRWLVLETATSTQPKLAVVRATPERAAAFAPSEALAFTSPDGVKLTGTLITPAGLTAPRLIIYCHEIPEAGARPAAYEPNPELQALAALGFAVVEINYRGSTGMGLKHLAAGSPAFAEMVAADLKATVDWLIAKRNFTRGQVALVGSGFGGYLALHAAQVHPDDFRAVVAIESPSDPAGWMTAMENNPYFSWDPQFLGGAKAPYPNLQATAATLTAKVMLLHEPAPHNFPRIPTEQITGLRDALTQTGHSPEWLELKQPFTAGTPVERAAVFLKIGHFLDTSLPAAKATR